jgi:probable rRNA maturation factor
LEITLLNRQRTCPVPRESLARFLKRLTGELPTQGATSVAVVLVSDRRMRDFNRTYRRTDAATNVLSFPADNAPGPDDERHLGDIVISVESARRHARRARHSLGRELQRLALHGYLHLLGYDHETDDGAMVRLERALARQLLRRRGGGGVT